MLLKTLDLGVAYEQSKQSYSHEVKRNLQRHKRRVTAATSPPTGTYAHTQKHREREIIATLPHYTAFQGVFTLLGTLSTDTL